MKVDVKRARSATASKSGRVIGTIDFCRKIYVFSSVEITSFFPVANTFTRMYVLVDYD